MREIVLDTETTGLDPESGHRIVEIGCIELVNHIPTGTTFHRYLNPERDMPPDAFAVHGLSAEFLAQHPTFAEVAMELLGFLGDAPLVIHNAAFDVAFLNAELRRLGLSVLRPERSVDTLVISRRKHPAGPHSLDQLCLRYAIDNSRRTKHGALLDAELLAEVYLELIGGRQPALILTAGSFESVASVSARVSYGARPAVLPPRLTESERMAHAAFLATLGESALWRRYQGSVNE
jgi:DNA polymerase III subunit epsilon